MTNLDNPTTYIASIRAAYAIAAHGELYDAMTQLAEQYIHQGDTQIACDILAFILLQNDVPVDVHEHAWDMFDMLERSICPRVIWDAKAFAHDMDLQGIVDYVLDIEVDDA
jgi:hypothetical protein